MNNDDDVVLQDWEFLWNIVESSNRDIDESVRTVAKALMD